MSGRGLLESYPHRMAGHCGSGALRDLLDWAGLRWGGSAPAEGLVFGLGGGLDFSYLRVPGLAPPIYLVGRGGDMEVDLLRRLDANVELRQTDDAALGWRWVRDELAAGRPVMVWADIAELPYLRVRLQMSRHDVVVVGYDDERQIAYVVDNDREDVQEVPYAALGRARRSSGFPTPTRHATFAIEWPERLPDLRSAAADAFAVAAAGIRHGGRGIVDSPDLPPGSISAAGLAGIREFAEDLASWPQVWDPVTLETALAALPVFIEKAGTGGGLFRRLQAACCHDVAGRTGSGASARAGLAYDRCAEAWSRLGRAATADAPLLDRVATAAEAAARLPALEEEAADLLAAAADELRSPREGGAQAATHS